LRFEIHARFLLFAFAAVDLGLGFHEDELQRVRFRPERLRELNEVLFDSILAFVLLAEPAGGLAMATRGGDLVRRQAAALLHFAPAKAQAVGADQSPRCPEERAVSLDKR
jgi:hypothetical protein